MPISKTNINTISRDTVSQISQLVSNQQTAQQVIVEEPKTKPDYKDNINLKLPRGERNRLKGFCAAHDISMTQFIVFAIDYLQSRVEDGLSSVSKMGVKDIRKGE